MPLFRLLKNKLYLQHSCEACQRWPSEDPDEDCLMCGYSQNRIQELKVMAEEMMKAYKLYKHNKLTK